MNRPDAEAQIAFLQQVQRLFGEGEFVATYKFALVLALAEMAVELGDDTGAELNIPLRALGEKFAELYWRQVSAYSSGQPNAHAAVLLQNNGKQAAVIRHLSALHRRWMGRLSGARSDPDWGRCITDITFVVKGMPLKYLQVIGGKLEPFLYDLPLPARAMSVRLKPGVAFHLRRYQGLIQQLARAGWIGHVRQNRLNAPMLGQIDDLETFMFGSPRAALTEVAPILGAMQSHRCFYCGERMDGRAEVDHFIPWSRYPRDTAHNFVLAHRACNNDKRDMLAARPHLERWQARNHRHGVEIGEALMSRGFIADVDASIKVARWAYQQAVEAGSMSWLGRKLTELVSAECVSLLG